MKLTYFIAAIFFLKVELAHAEDTFGSLAMDYFFKTIDIVAKPIDDRAEQRRQDARKRARIVPRGARPEIVIRRTGIGSFGDAYFADGILFNGQRITINDPPSRAIEVFGNDFRVHKGIHIWDKIGISMYTTTPSQHRNGKPQNRYISTISIILNPTPEDMPNDPSNPSQFFSGYLELDGAGIDKNTKIWEVRALHDRTGLRPITPYLMCHRTLPFCDVEVRGKERSDRVSFYTDPDQENGKIYFLTYLFWK